MLILQRQETWGYIWMLSSPVKSLHGPSLAAATLALFPAKRPAGLLGRRRRTDNGRTKTPARDDERRSVGASAGRGAVHSIKNGSAKPEAHDLFTTIRLSHSFER